MSDNIKIFFATVIDPKAKVLLFNTYDQVPAFSKEFSKKSKEKIHIICGIWWSIETVKNWGKIIFSIYKNRLQYPNIHISVLANTRKEHFLLKMAGIKTVFCNQNCFVDENLFTYKPAIEKKYDAIYNGQLLKFKRHYLCTGIQNLALITYNFHFTEYKAYVDSILKNHQWLNYNQNNEPRFLSNTELADAYNTAYCGLALSKIEGAMYASVEYMLCGTPVVSTKSKGGRSEFFVKENAVVVNDTAEEVSAAVNELVKHPYDPLQVRNTTLSLMMVHRQYFFNHVNTILQKRGFNYKIEASWNKWFKHKLREELSFDDLLNRLNK